jgi:hypothetical protein
VLFNNLIGEIDLYGAINIISKNINSTLKSENGIAGQVLWLKFENDFL